MKLRFKHQKFQDEAVKAVCDVFSGQVKSEKKFQVDAGDGFDFGEIGFGNGQITLTDDQLMKNIREVQKQHGIYALSSKVETLGGKPVFTVEMETGTGKTYTYIKTMYELYAQYGWRKFIVVVPSIAIREGVLKSFQTTADHFAEDYGKKIRFFIYNSDRLNELEQFSDDPGINAMIINTQAFNATGANARRIREKLDSFRSRKPIDVIAATNPIIIVDEPQSVLGTDDKKNKTRETIMDFNPLFFVNYSATHRENFNMVYRLDAVDAYQQKLVKKITVKGITVNGAAATNGYLYLQRVNKYPNKKPDATVTFEFDASGSGKTKRITRILKREDNIYEHSGQLAEYRNGYTIAEINGITNTVRFVNGLELHEGEVVGDSNADNLRRIQIRETIMSHLAKERELYKKGIKVLSLFFIDEVAKYKSYEDGVEKPGPYWTIFEEEYKNAVDTFMQELPYGEDEDYRKFLEQWDVSKIHNGYFSIDKKGHAVNSEVKRGETESADTDAYDLIMRNKERLLSFSEPTRFIFSHSALREGWDNPNVFQICTLRESSGEIKKRQEIGRGLRLCVDQDGNRMDSDVLGARSVHDINELVVIANESYDTFARELQDEFAEVIKNRPKTVSPELFAGQSFIDASGQEFLTDSVTAAIIYTSLLNGGVIEKDGKVTDEYFDLSEEGKIAKIKECIPDENIAQYADNIERLVASVYDAKRNPIVSNARDKAVLNLDHEKYDSKAFKELWSRINEKTYYTVSFDDEDIIRRSVDAINKNLVVTQTRVTITTGYLKETGQDNLEMQKLVGKDVILEEVTSTDIEYDLIGEIARHTKLTRRTVAAILFRIEREKFDLFKKNPEEFIHEAAKYINEQKAATVIEHITYDRIGETWNAEEIFVDDEITGNYSSNVIDTPNKHLYDKLRYDSENEKKFAGELETKDDVELYVKLPSGFYIETPMGKYNPDWAIAFKEGSVKHVYFVAETKGDSMQMSLRGLEEAKIECARKHFAKISNDTVVYDVVSSYDELYKLIAA